MKNSNLFFIFLSFISCIQAEENNFIHEMAENYPPNQFNELSISKEEAIDIFSRFYNLNSNQYIKSHFHQAKLIKWKNDNNHLKMVYKVSFIIDSEKPSRPFAYIDSETGEILKVWEGLNHATKKLKGFGGNEKTKLVTYGDDAPYLIVNKNNKVCSFENDYVKTISNNNSLNMKVSNRSAVQVACERNDFNVAAQSKNGSYSPINDAHFYGTQTALMFESWFNETPLEDKIILVTHYGYNWRNAVWSGEAAFFGDGNDEYYPFTGINIVAHEIGHGVTERYSNLVNYGMSGAIGEAFSDMTGEALEYYLHGSVDWAVGANLLKDPNDAMRYFDRPEKKIKHISHTSSYHSGVKVHHGSGIYSHAFYLLSHAASWDIQKAFSVFYHANKIYWESETTFDKAACGVMKATIDLGYETTAVREAFETVGVTPCSLTHYMEDGDTFSFSIEEGEKTYIEFSLQENQRAILTLDSNDGHTDVSVLNQYWPTENNYDCKTDSDAGMFSCEVIYHGSGMYKAVVTSESSVQNQQIQLTIDPMDVELLSPRSSYFLNSEERTNHYFELDSIDSEFTSVKIGIKGGSGDADLYVNRGTYPSSASFICRPYKKGNSEECIITNLPSEKTYVMLSSQSAYSGAMLTVEPLVLPQVRGESGGQQGAGHTGFALLGLILSLCYRANYFRHIPRYY